MDHKIKQFVYRVRARLREQQIITNLIKYAGIGLFIAVILSFLSLVVPLYYAVPVAVGIVGICFAVGIIMGIHKTPTPMEAALRADAKGHKEKISTALFLKGKEDPFSILQKKDALKIVNTFQVRKEFPLRLKWKQVLIVVGLALVFVVSSLIDTPARENARVKNDVAKEAKEDIARLEKVEKKIEESKEISETEAAGIKEQIENAKKELSEADSREDLKKAEERITKKIEMASEKTGNKILSETLSEAAKEARDAAEKKENDLIEETKEALAKAEKGSRKEKQEAYEKLKKLAAVVGDENLKKVAEEYKASSYSDSNYAEAERALNKALENVTSKRSYLASSQNNTFDNNQSNNPDSAGQNNNQNGNANQNSSSGNGQGDSGQNGNGSGNGNGTGSGWNYGGREGSEGGRKTNENITVPDGEIGDDENLTGKANANNSSTKEKSSQSQTWSGNKVSYGEVSGSYKEKAYKKVNGSRYPGKLKDKIRDYFDGLN